MLLQRTATRAYCTGIYFQTLNLKPQKKGNDLRDCMAFSFVVHHSISISISKNQKRNAVKMLKVQVLICGLLSLVSMSMMVTGTKLEVSNNPVTASNLLLASMDTVTATTTSSKIPLVPNADTEPDKRRLDGYPRQYLLWKPEEIKNKVVEWKSLYPNLAHVTTAQEAYDLPRSGGANDCPYDEGGDGCLNYIITMQDFVAHPKGSDSSNHLPEVFWSGCVHGKPILYQAYHLYDDLCIYIYQADPTHAIFYCRKRTCRTNFSHGSSNSIVGSGDMRGKTTETTLTRRI